MYSIIFSLNCEYCATLNAASEGVQLILLCSIKKLLAEMVAEMFLVPIEDVDLSQSPSQQGVDSLIAVEVRNMLFTCRC